jgi:hypothetical protein
MHTMPRYLVERTFPDGLAIPIDENGEKAVQGVVSTNAGHGVADTDIDPVQLHEVAGGNPFFVTEVVRPAEPSCL